MNSTPGDCLPLRHPLPHRLLMSTLLGLSWLAPALPGMAAVRVSPPAIELRGPDASQQILVSADGDAGRIHDVTRQASYQFSDPAVATIDPLGLIVPLREGHTELIVRQAGQELRVPVDVHELLQPRPVSFEHQIIPVLTKAGCNMGGCHGKAEGQNGFKLSVFGFDPPSDYDALMKEGRARRVFTASPDRSLLLLKAASVVPHGGGRKIALDSPRYRLLRRWVDEGAVYGAPGPVAVVSIELEPEHQVLSPGETQQLRVTAIDADGNRRCVTAESEYSSNADVIAGCDSRGLIQAGQIPGEVALLARYMGHVAVCRVTLPRAGVTFARPAENNFIDGHVWNKLQVLGIVPSEGADDAMFLRRAMLDATGTLPSAEESREFLASTDPEKRARLIDRVLDREEFADYWAMRWADILRVDSDKITPQGVVGTTRWLRKQIATNRPYDQFVYDIVTARGNSTAEGPASFFKAVDGAEAMARSISQLFLGVRIECAQCHHHPSEKWGQDDYFAFAGFFTGVATKPLPFGGQAVFSRGGADLKNPRTGLVVPTRALGAPPVEFSPNDDRRQALARWMTAPDNPFLARSIVNRLWSHYFGRGLVMPIDDMRATNPASNEPLLTALAAHMRDVKFDIKAFTRTMMNSRAYQLSSATNESNMLDEQNFSHAAHKALPAEVLLDAICQVTGVGEKFVGWPTGFRAIQVWDNRMPSYFFKIFGRPTRVSVCECERSNEPSIAQALHLMNSPEIIGKIQSPDGHARQLAQSAMTPPEIINELYLAALSRPPQPGEAALMLEAFASAGENRRAAIEDILWALLNSKEFLCIP